MNMKSRQLRRGIAALAVVSALTACAKEKDDDKGSTTAVSASPSPTGTPTTTPDQVQAFCNSLIALDTAIISLGPPEEEPEPEATATPGPTAASMSASEAETASPTATGAPTATGSPIATSTPMASEAPEGAGGPSFPDVATAMRPVADMLANTKTREIATAADAMVSILRQAVSTGDRELLENEAYGAADAPLDAYGLQNCNYKSISTSAIDYEFDNLPSTASAGKTSITLKNEGKEFHEIVLLRVNDGVTESTDEILDLPEEQLFSKITLSFITVVPPGKTGTGFTDLKAGRYIALCFIPKGAEPGKEPARDAPPHFAEGMLEEITVT